MTLTVFFTLSWYPFHVLTGITEHLFEELHFQVTMRINRMEADRIKRLKGSFFVNIVDCLKLSTVFTKHFVLDFGLFQLHNWIHLNIQATLESRITVPPWFLIFRFFFHPGHLYSNPPTPPPYYWFSVIFAHIFECK